MTEPIVCPGDRLAATSEFAGGDGTYTKDRFVFASLTGVRTSVFSKTEGSESKPVISVLKRGAVPLVPKKQDIVTAQVTKITPRLVATDILCVGNRPLPDERFQGVIRLEDVRAAEIDKVQIALCFRPGDIVKAEVVSLGTSRDYYLSTAQNHLGVVYAKSLAGVPMVPVNWQEMQCPQTKAIEKRKVAKA
ncbi:hypothetical protein WJX82_000709 [Trebouxia sp. C0006]